MRIDTVKSQYKHTESTQSRADNKDAERGKRRQRNAHTKKKKEVEHDHITKNTAHTHHYKQTS